MTPKYLVISTSVHIALLLAMVVVFDKRKEKPQRTSFFVSYQGVSPAAKVGMKKKVDLPKWKSRSSSGDVMG